MNDWMFLMTGFGIGLAGSIHCIGMCGPLVMSLPIQSFQTSGKFVAIGLYHLGRLMSYTLLGAWTGLIGRQFFIGGYQRAFSIAMGVGLLAALLLMRSGHTFFHRSWIYKKVQGMIVRFLRRPSMVNIWLLGVANGWLPCGMVYVGLVAAASTGSVLQAGLVMLFFGLGTVPLMSLAAMAGIYIRPATRASIKKLSPYAVAIVAVLLVLRGLNLGIPFISPHIAGPEGRETLSCH